VNGVYQNICSLFYPRPEGRGYSRRFSNKALNCPAVYGWDNNQTFHSRDGVHAISIDQNAMNGVCRNIDSSFYPRPEGRGYYRQSLDKAFKCPAIYGWDDDRTSYIRWNGVHAIYKRRINVA